MLSLKPRQKYVQFLDDNSLDFVITPVIHGIPARQRSTEEFQEFKTWLAILVAAGLQAPQSE